MKLQLFTLLAALVFFGQNKAQNSFILPLSTSVAQTSTADNTHIAAFINPSVYAYFSKTSLLLSFDNRFLIPELSTKSISANYDVGFLQTGFSFSHYGYSLYHEMMTGIAFARNFGDKFAFGLQFNYYQAYFNASNSYKGTLFPQIGFSIHITPDVLIAGNIFNPFQNSIKTIYVTQNIPSFFSFGGCYRFSSDFCVRLQADKQVNNPFRLAGAFDYKIKEVFNVKGGIYYQEYLVSCFGVSWQSNKFLLGLNTELHPLLGLNTGATIGFIFNKK